MGPSAVGGHGADPLSPAQTPVLSPALRGEFGGSWLDRDPHALGDRADMRRGAAYSASLAWCSIMYGTSCGRGVQLRQRRREVNRPWPGGTSSRITLIGRLAHLKSCSAPPRCARQSARLHSRNDLRVIPVGPRRVDQVPPGPGARRIMCRSTAWISRSISAARVHHVKGEDYRRRNARSWASPRRGVVARESPRPHRRPPSEKFPGECSAIAVPWQYEPKMVPPPQARAQLLGQGPGVQQSLAVGVAACLVGIHEVIPVADLGDHEGPRTAKARRISRDPRASLEIHPGGA